MKRSADSRGPHSSQAISPILTFLPLHSKAATRSPIVPASIAKSELRPIRRVHVEGTANVLEAARRSGVRRVLLLSFLRARPNCGSAYHESKWAAEELVRNSGLEFTILKAGMIYGRGDHMLDHLSHSLFTLPLLATVGFRQRAVRPLAVDDIVNVMTASLPDGRLSGKTVSVLGPETLFLSDAVRRVAQVLGRRS
jgi:NADH dehydrogenase